MALWVGTVLSDNVTGIAYNLVCSSFVEIPECKTHRAQLKGDRSPLTPATGIDNSISKSTEWHQSNPVAWLH